MSALGVFQSNMNDVGQGLDLYFVDSITALAGGGQTNAVVLNGQVNRITVVGTANDSVRLLPFTPGRWQTVINADAADNLAVYPPVGGQFSGAAVNASFVVPAGTTAQFFVATTTLAYPQFVASTSGASIPVVQNTSISAASGVIPAANVAGAQFVTLTQSGATALTTPTAAAMLAAIPNGVVGTVWRLRVINTNGGTLTITADASVTATGTLTLATQTWRDFDMKIVTATTATMVSVGTGTNS